MRLGTTAVYLYRDHYEPELAHLEDFVPEGSTVIDVGANLGLYTVVAAKLVGPRGRVIAVEPSAATFELLRHNVALNGLGNVTLVNKALSDGVGAARLYHIAGAPNYSLGAPADPGTAYEDVETVSLDRLVTDCGAADVSCVKIDVEGAEHLVVRGGTGCLARWRPAVIFEVNDENAGRFGSSGTDTVAALRELGYRFEVAAGDCLVPLSGPPGTGNVVARHGTRARGV